MNTYTKTTVAIVLSLATGGLIAVGVLAPKVDAAQTRADEQSDRAVSAESEMASLQAQISSLRTEVQQARSEAKQARREAKKQLAQVESGLQVDLDAARATIALLQDDLRRAARTGPLTWRCTSYDLDLSTLDAGECYEWEATR